jgi:hypothetical protein
MNKLLMLPVIAAVAGASASAQTNPPPGPVVETLVCFRHGEKQPTGLGQLSCQGLNRALALPPVLLAKYPGPQFMFAPNPTLMITEYAGSYDYVRPLATIEPTAIYCGLPVNTQYGFGDVTNLEAELRSATYQNATVYIAWEHLNLVEFVQDMLAACGGDASQVPAWADDDYDTIFVVRITRNGGAVTAAFSVDHEGLNNLSSGCPLTQVNAGPPGVRTNRFGFGIIGATNAAVVVEASTNLASATWTRLATNILAGGKSYFSDPCWTNYWRRFYRLGLP